MPHLFYFLFNQSMGIACFISFACSILAPSTLLTLTEYQQCKWWYIYMHICAYLYVCISIYVIKISCDMIAGEYICLQQFNNLEIHIILIFSLVNYLKITIESLALSYNYRNLLLAMNLFE